MLSVHQRQGRTDGQTDGRTTYDSNTALALRASRGKKHDLYRLCDVASKKQLRRTFPNFVSQTYPAATHFCLRLIIRSVLSVKEFTVVFIHIMRSRLVK